MNRAGIQMLLLLTACSAPPPEPPLQRELRSVSATGTETFLRGDLRVADASFYRALELARLLDDPHEIGNGAHNLAATRLEADRTDGIAGLIAEARAALVRAGESTADLELLDARVAMHTGRVAEARASMVALADADDTPASGRLRALLRLVELDLFRDEIALARGWYERALAHAGDDAEGPLLLEALGQLRLAEGDPLGAAETLDRAAREFSQRRLPRAMAHALELAARAHAEAGRLADAADRWLRAGGAELALRQVDQARSSARRAQDAAIAIGDAQLLERASSLIGETDY